MNIVLICRSARAPKRLPEPFRNFWKEATATYRLGQDAVPARDLVRHLGAGDTLVFESMRVMMDFGTRSRPNWWRAWEQLSPMVAKGTHIVWLREQLILDAGPSDIKAILDAGAKADAEYRAEVARARQVINNPKAGGSRRVRGWVKPGRAMLQRIQTKVGEVGVSKACSEEGISRTTYYEWKKKGLFV
ncbi:hypothetical protein [Marinimicrobium sp. ABcell2]|uniref:hypothetical protein n=1 Tax=Marinimicrobium sp. ABcell2 TaxID=3069751 RepID=UPI0027B5D05F|nr:hypothetical protein [Marinimicrobium sp. ABcell2]MDQ2077522.1 hypothetical protein [Marinimicrobium sp. ABcell2]